MLHLATPELDPTPPRPSQPAPDPPHLLRASLTVSTAHLANPTLAVQRLLASEAGLFAAVSGDDDRIEIAVALPDDRPTTRDTAAAWIQWVTHVAGIRGQLSV